MDARKGDPSRTIKAIGTLSARQPRCKGGDPLERDTGPEPDHQEYGRVGSSCPQPRILSEECKGNGRGAKEKFRRWGKWQDLIS